jgi:hypothetical protein
MKRDRIGRSSKIITNEIGKRYARLIVVSRAPNDDHGNIRWHCLCDCGKTTVSYAHALHRGRTKSCGCIRIEMFRKACSLPKGEAARNCVLLHYRTQARQRGIPFELTRDEFFSLISQDCYYCGASPSQECGRGIFNGSCIYNGVDRKDNSGCYSLKNAVAACGRCNRMKWTLSADDFIAVCSAVAARHKRDNL